MSFVVRRAGAYVIVVLLFLTVLRVAESAETPLKVLKQLSLDSREISRVMKGEIVSKKLDTSDKRDVAVLGAMLLNVPPIATVEAARDIKTFKHGKEILGLEKFEKFNADEMKSLILEDEELADLGDCRVQDCDSKMPGLWIKKLSTEADPAKRLSLLQNLLTEYARDYSARGNKAVLNYDNTKHSVAAQKEFASILDHSTYLKALAPEFFEYLKDYPDKQIAGTENFIYWSREKFGFKPVINLTHVSIYKWSRSGLSGYLIASRQIYADHYYDASLGLTILIDRPMQQGKSMGSYLIYINRSRIDMLGGFLSSLRKAITLSRVRSGLESHMKSMKTRVEDKSKK